MSLLEADADGPLVTHRPLRDDAKFDITAMIDLVFMMNIYFLVTTVTAALAEMDLPLAKNCTATDASAATVISISDSGNGGQVFIGDGPSGQPLMDAEEVQRAVREAVEEGVRQDKGTVLLKAEKQVRMRDVARVAAAAATVSGTELRLAVIEQE
jgi:biopolymer transport protein ExbD